MKKRLFIIILIIIIFLSVKPVYINILKHIYPIKFKQEIFFYSKKYNIDPYLVCAVIKSESNFNNKAISLKNAKGLMQITDSTAFWISEKLNIENFRSEMLFNPDYNIMFGTWYLSYLINYYNGNIKYTIMAYNAGLSNVNKWIKNREGVDVEIPFNETKLFLRGVLRNYEIYKTIYPNYFDNYYNN
ncbi:lytic transglycosylase domain-containing protein [Caldicellulosiruptoraceae bacterium PP1]